MKKIKPPGLQEYLPILMQNKFKIISIYMLAKMDDINETLYRIF